MRWQRGRSGLILPRRGGPCSILAVTALSGFGAVGASAEVAGVPVWDPASDDPDVTVSNGDRTAAMGASTGSARSLTSIGGAAKRYVEFDCDATGGDNWRCGVGTDAFDVTTGPGNGTTSWAYTGNGNKRTNNSNTAYGSSNTNGDVLMCAVDMGLGAVWWGLNGTWFASGDPAAGSNSAFTGLTGPLFLLFGRAGGSGTWQATLRVPGSYAYSPPTGFLAGW